MKKTKTIAIIPARGNSKRFPGKNLVSFNEVPLLAHSITYAKANSTIIDEVYVSTNDAEIAKVAIAYGAKVIERPAILSGDLEPTVTALKHVVEQCGEQVENVVLLQATNPLRPLSMLRKCFEEFERGFYDSAMTVSRNHQKFGKIIDGNFEPFNYTFGQRSQDLEPLYFENGLLYIIKAKLILEEKMLGAKNLPFIVNHPFSKVDIDTKEDLAYAEYVLKNYKENQ